MMRFVIVNGRVPFAPVYCACCTKRLVEGYLREFSTGLYYCNETTCFSFSEEMAMQAITRRTA